MHSKPKRQSRAGARFSRSNCSTVAIGKFAFAYKGVVYSAGNLNISTLGFPAIYLYFRGERNRGRELDIPSHRENMECQWSGSGPGSSALSCGCRRYPMATTTREVRRGAIKSTTSRWSLLVVRVLGSQMQKHRTTTPADRNSSSSRDASRRFVKKGIRWFIRTAHTQVVPP